MNYLYQLTPCRLILIKSGRRTYRDRKITKRGIPHTILRNGWYTENYTGSVAGAVGAGAFAGSAGAGKISSATCEDFAEEVANLVVYVASPLSSATTGAALRVDGGVVDASF